MKMEALALPFLLMACNTSPDSNVNSEKPDTFIVECTAVIGTVFPETQYGFAR